MYKHILVTALVLMSGDGLFGGVAPFGIEMGVATEEDLQNKYSVYKIGKTKYAESEIYAMRLDKAPFEVDKKITSIQFYSSEGKIHRIHLKKEVGFLHKSFNVFFDELKSKYPLIEDKKPRLGNYYAKFQDGDVEIILQENHFLNEVDLTYTTENFNMLLKNSIEMQHANEELKKTSKRNNALESQL
jgi:hypothetical protein